MSRQPTSDTSTEELTRELGRRDRVEEELQGLLVATVTKAAASDELFRLLVASVRDYAIFMLDPSGQITTWNSGAERLKGYRANEAIGEHVSRFYPEEDLRAGKCETQLEIAATTGRYEEESWRIRKDGTRFWANVVVTAMRDRDGVLVGFGNVTRDLTQHKRAEEDRERFRRFVESVQDYAMFLLDPTGRVETWNLGAERIKGYRADEIIGQHFSRFYPEEDLRAGKCEMELEAAAQVGRFEDEGWRLRKNGTRFWANVVITALRDSSGRLTGFSKVTRDLTERKRSEDERAARLSAEQANRTKDEFLAMLGHELRNPLAPIVTALQLIKLRGDARASREHQVIERQVQHMMHLVDDLLDVSRVSRGKLELRMQAIDLRDALANGIEIASPLFEQKEHHFELEVPPMPLPVEGDPARLTQVFANLLTNAGKYTERGGQISLRVRQAGHSEIVVEVRDSGIGIDHELLPRVFDLFVQGYQTSERATGGLGLGLTLVRSLVHMHGGKIDAFSAGLGTGSTFTVRLPSLAREPSADTSGRFSSPFVRTNHRRILVVDDNEDARLLLADILRELGHEVAVAGDGTEALALVGDFSPEVAILDIGLPGMDGYELAAALRDALLTPVRLIALSGYGMPADRARSQVAGFDRHLVKPVEVRRLVDTIAELAG